MRFAGLRAVKEKDKAAGEKYEDNILFDLLFSGHIRNCLRRTRQMADSAIRRGLAITATVALQGGEKGIAAGIERANRLSANSDERTAALTTSGNQAHAPTAVFRDSGHSVHGCRRAADSAGTAENIIITRQLTLWKGEYLPASDPRFIVQRFYLSTFMGTFTASSANDLMTRHAYSSDDDWNRAVERVMQSRGALHVRSERSGLPAAALMDYITGHLKLTSEGDDETGYKITCDSLGAKPTTSLVTRDNGSYHVVATEGSRYSVTGGIIFWSC